MNKAIFLLVIFSLNSALSFAQRQEPLTKEFALKENPKIHQISEDEAKESYLFILDKHVREIFYSATGTAREYALTHVIKHLNDDESLDANNKVYIPNEAYFYDIQFEARIIKKDGSVIPFDESDVLEEQNEEGGSYQYFAFEGLEKGDEVEYYYLIEREPYLSGNRMTLQGSALKRSAEFVLITPPNLKMKTKSKNGFPVMKMDSSYENHNYLYGIMPNLKGLNNEKYAAFKANQAHVLYMLYKNTYSGTTLDPYPKLTKIFSNQISGVNAKKAKLHKFIGNMEIDEGLGTKEKIRAIEDYLKRTIFYEKKKKEGLNDLKTILKTKEANAEGMRILYAKVFDAFDISYQLVYTTNRFNDKFDQEFESYFYLDQLLFYFPKVKAYLAPTDITSRLGFIPYRFTNNYGFFTKFTDLGDGFKTGLAKIKFIEPTPAEESIDKFEIQLNLTRLPKTKNTLHRELTGHSADFQTLWSYLDEETTEELTESFVKYIDEDMEINQVEIENMTAADFGVNPIVIDAIFTSDIFVKKAGTNYIINVGKLIGPQAELYQESERQLDVENGFNKIYKRTIVVQIPDGYDVLNLDKLAMEVVYENEDGKGMGFVSTYTMEEHVLTINVEEYYERLHIPVEEYEDFKNVINAAADFNKLTILLKPFK